MILRLEERDDSFHKYEVVRHIRRSLNDAVGAFIEDEIDKQRTGSSSASASSSTSGSTPGRDASIESVVEKITEEVVNSNRFSGVENLLRHEISSAVRNGDGVGLRYFKWRLILGVEVLITFR